MQKSEVASTKRAVLLHGTDGSTEYCWFPWTNKLLRQSGYEVFAPSLPYNHTPSREVYEKFLQNSGWNFEDNVIIGHSSGATTILNLLDTDWFPKLKAAVFVGVFLNEKLTKTVTWYEPGQFDKLFTKPYDIEKLKSKVEKYYFVHGDNDPFCDIDDAKDLCRKLNGEMIIIQGGHHLGDTSGVVDLPSLEEALKKDDII